MSHRLAILPLFACLLGAPCAAAETGDLLKSLAARDDLAEARVVTGQVTAYWVTAHEATPLEKGTFTLTTDGRLLARLELSLPVVGRIEWSSDDERTWEIDPMAGPIVRAGEQASGVERLLCAIVGGAGWREVYDDSTEKDRPERGLDPVTASRVAYELTPSLGERDTWSIGKESGLLDAATSHAPTGDGTTSAVRVELDGWVEEGGAWRAKEILIEREHYRFVLSERQVDWDGFDVDDVRMDDATKSQALSGAQLDAEAAEMRIRHQGEVHVASIRTKVKTAELSLEFATLLPEVHAFLREAGIDPIGAPFARYHEFTPTEVDVEVGFPVAKAIEASGRVEPRTLPGGRTLSTWHVGPYHELPRTYTRVQRWMKEQGLVARGPNWEFYWTDPGLVPDPSKWRTQVVHPIE